jgi:hypothetical protein
MVEKLTSIPTYLGNVDDQLKLWCIGRPRTEECRVLGRVRPLRQLHVPRPLQKLPAQEQQVQPGAKTLAYFSQRKENGREPILRSLVRYNIRKGGINLQHYK